MAGEWRWFGKNFLENLVFITTIITNVVNNVSSLESEIVSLGLIQKKWNDKLKEPNNFPNFVYTVTNVWRSSEISKRNSCLTKNY